MIFVPIIRVEFNSIPCFANTWIIFPRLSCSTRSISDMAFERSSTSWLSSVFGWWISQSSINWPKTGWSRVGGIIWEVMQGGLQRIVSDWFCWSRRKVLGFPWLKWACDLQAFRNRKRRPATSDSAVTGGNRMGRRAGRWISTPQCKRWAVLTTRCQTNNQMYALLVEHRWEYVRYSS